MNQSEERARLMESGEELAKMIGEQPEWLQNQMWESLRGVCTGEEITALKTLVGAYRLMTNPDLYEAAKNKMAVEVYKAFHGEM